MFWEEFTAGRTLMTGVRMVTEDDLETFIELSGLDNPIFTSDEGARAAGHPGRLIPAPMQLSLAMGLCQKAGLFDRVAAVAGFDQMKFLRPVHPGDQIRVEVTIISRKATSKPERGLVELDYRILKQDDQPVMTTRATYLIRTRASDLIF